MNFFVIFKVFVFDFKLLKWDLIIWVSCFLVGLGIFSCKYCCKKGGGKLCFLLFVIIIKGNCW